MREHLERLFDHNWWADDRVLALFEATEAVPGPHVLRLFSHVLAAERVWLDRINGSAPSTLAIWPEWTVAEARSVLAENRAEYRELLNRLGDDALMEEVAYTNSQGTPFRTHLIDVLTHVALHGSYHRGQIALAVRSAGGEPVNTDYITFVRETGPEAGPKGPAQESAASRTM